MPTPWRETAEQREQERLILVEVADLLRIAHWEQTEPGAPVDAIVHERPVWAIEVKDRLESLENVRRMGGLWLEIDKADALGFNGLFVARFLPTGGGVEGPIRAIWSRTVVKYPTAWVRRTDRDKWDQQVLVFLVDVDDMWRVR